jgi:hypothetical protein
MDEPTCELCEQTKTMLRTASAETFVCPNCDQYPWMIQPMTGREVMDQDARASRIAREKR